MLHEQAPPQYVLIVTRWTVYWGGAVRTFLSVFSVFDLVGTLAVVALGGSTSALEVW